MNIPENLKYTKNHEWIKQEGEKAIIGITNFAQQSLGDIVFIELPSINKDVSAGEAFCVIESVKAASDVYSPVSGSVIDINNVLEDSPELINENPYENWLVVVSISTPSELDSLLDSASYKKLCDEEA